MPIFEYVCKDCGLKFEVLSNRWDGKCPQCGSENIKRRFSPCSWNFRGLFELIQEEEQEERNASGLQ